MVWKKTARDKTLSEFHETRVKLALFDNIFVKFLPKFKQKWSWQKFCNILSNFCQLVIFPFCCWKILTNFCQKSEKIANEKSWQNFVKRLWILFQCFVDDELCQTIVSVLRETTCKMLKNCHQNLVTSTMNNWHTQYFRDKHKCNIRLHFKNHVNSYAHD